MYLMRHYCLFSIIPFYKLPVDFFNICYNRICLIIRQIMASVRNGSEHTLIYLEIFKAYPHTYIFKQLINFFAALLCWFFIWYIIKFRIKNPSYNSRFFLVSSSVIFITVRMLSPSAWAISVLLIGPLLLIKSKTWLLFICAIEYLLYLTGTLLHPSITYLT